MEKAKTFISKTMYEKHKSLIDNIFYKQSLFIKNSGEINSLLIIKKLRKYGLFSLYLQGKQDVEINISSKVYNNLLLFVKNIKESFMDLGFNYIFVKHMKYTNNNLILNLVLRSEAMINPIFLDKEFQKRGIEILSIVRIKNTIWNYNLSSNKAKIPNALDISLNQKTKINKIINDIYINIDESEFIEISSHAKNKWYPHVVCFDKDFHPIKILKKDRITRNFTFAIPKYTKYIKITDKYVIKNIKHGIHILLKKS